MIRYTHNKTERHPFVDFPGRSHWPDDKGYSLQVMSLFLSTPTFLNGVYRAGHFFLARQEQGQKSSVISNRLYTKVKQGTRSKVECY